MQVLQLCTLGFWQELWFLIWKVILDSTKVIF